MIGGVHSGSYHASVEITPNNQARWSSDPRFSARDASGHAFLTLGAGPSASGRLVSNLNRQADSASAQAATVTVPTPGGEDAAIERLLRADGNYRDDAPYTFFPALQGGYNSNSYVSGILSAAGLHRPAFSLPMPGYTSPLPPRSFQP